MSSGLTTLQSNLLLARIQHAVGESVLSRGRSRRYRHLPKRFTSDHSVLMIAKQTLDALVVLDRSFRLSNGLHSSAA
jgi:hypothetical protein